MKTGVPVGANDHSPVRPAGALSFEPLEPRVLLDASLLGIQPLVTCSMSPPPPQQAIYVDLDQRDGSIQTDLSPVLTIELAPCDQTNQPASTSASPENAVAQVGCGVVAESAAPDSSAILEDDAAGPVVSGQQDITVGSDTSSIGIRGPPDLPGLRLVSPDISNWQGQVIYLDFDGAEGIVYNGPVTVGPFDVAAFKAPSGVEGQEGEIIQGVLSELSRVFAGTGIIFTSERPSASQLYSTIYIGGNDSPFSQYGSFLGLAEQVDIGNQTHSDQALAFSEQLSGTSGDGYVVSLAAVVAHEAGHLLGYEHSGWGRSDLSATKCYATSPDMLDVAEVNFSTEQLISNTAHTANGLYACDINGDGNQDVVAALYGAPGEGVVWYKNKGAEGFEAQPVIGRPNGPDAVYACDLDGNGTNDVLVGLHQGASVIWYKNNGGGSFDPTPNPVGTAASLGTCQSVYACDLDDNGSNDVIAAYAFGIVWYKNMGGGNFSGPLTVYRPGTDIGGRSVYACDLNGDGYNDVLSATGNDNTIAWYKNNAGSFDGSRRVISTQASYANSVYACDLDGNGTNDVLSASRYDNKIAWYANDGTGNFGTNGSNQRIISTHASTAMCVYACDLDGDGDDDVLSASLNDDKIAWYANDGAGDFGTNGSNEQVISNHADGALVVCAADLDGDGDNDVLSTSGNDSKIAWYENSYVADNAGNTMATARDIGTLTTAQQFTDWVGSTDTNDYYKFTLSNPGRSSFGLIVSQMTADANVDLRDDGGVLIWSGKNTQTVPESWFSLLDAGTYYVRVYPGVSNADTYYTLSLSAPTSQYLLTGEWGGQAWDADELKGTDDDGIAPDDSDNLMCWAAAASNMLAWTGWGTVSAVDGTADGVFQYYRDYWTDLQGRPMFALRWWFDGINDGPVVDENGPWSQPQPTGGRFYPIGHDPYLSSVDAAAAMENIRDYFDAPDPNAVAVRLDYKDGHWLTCWGYDYDTSDEDHYVGIYLTDSDDGSEGVTRYGIDIDEDNGNQWMLTDGPYVEEDVPCYITHVDALRRKPDSMLEVPPSPQNVSATDDLTDKVTITWDATPRAASYQLLRNTTTDFAGSTQLAGGLSSAQYDDNTATVGVTYYYWVTASNTGGTSKESSPATGLRASPVHFADPNLMAAVEAALGVTGPTPSDMLGLTTLSVYDQGISDLTGLQCATNLTELELTSNQISDISALSGLTSLTSLYLDDNQIIDISGLSGLTNLDLLDLRQNPLNAEAYRTYIPRVLANNPGITLWYDPPASIAGTKWTDLDGDGIQDEDELGIEGWPILLDRGGDAMWDDSTTTAVDGSYAFTNLSAGTYVVAEESKNDWMQTCPGGEGTYTVTLGPGQAATKIDFGNVLPNVVDHDRDGIPSLEERGPMGNDPGYDGNGDGIPDNQQDNAASFHTYAGDYVTIASEAETLLYDVRSVENPSPAAVPARVKAPYGFFDFTVKGLTPGGAVVVELHLPAGSKINSYYKYGPTPDDHTAHWYKFKYDGQTGAEINDNVVRLHFVDGLRGDDDLTANARIVEPGAPVFITNMPPVVDAGADATIDEGTAFARSGSFTDPDIDDSWMATVDYGDGMGPQGLALNPDKTFEFSHSYADNGSYVVILTVTDDEGGIATDVLTVTVNDVAPTIALTGAASVEEGSAYTLTLGPITDPGDDTVSSYIIHWGDGTTEAYDRSGDVTHVYPHGPASPVIAVDLTDEDGTHPGCGTLDVQVTNVAPAVAADSADTAVDEGEMAVNAGTFSDPGQDTVTLTASIGVVADNGNGTWGWSYATTDGPDQSQAVTITATDDDGGATAVSFSLAVNNVAPSLDNASFEIEENSAIGTPVGIVSGNDPGDDALTYSIVGGNGASAFAIDANSAWITVADESWLDYETTPSFVLQVQVMDDDGATATAVVSIDLLNRGSITGTVFVDVNRNGLYEANEPGIDGVGVQLLYANGAPVLDSCGNAIIATTSDGGYYLFEDLDPGTYQLHEVQPAGVDDGAEILGSLGGAIAANDTMQLTLGRIDATDYDFAELGQSVASGDTATIGFWQNKHGQALIAQGGTALAGWLTDNFGNIFGDAFAGADGETVASFYRDQLFRQKATKSAGPAKVDAQFMALALSTYFTSSSLAGYVAADYGFHVTDTGIGTKVVNVGYSGAAFDVADGTDLTIMQLLLATNRLTDQPDRISGAAKIYDLNGNGEIEEAEAVLRRLANEVYSALNE